jgi:hypothetical protein
MPHASWKWGLLIWSVDTRTTYAVADLHQSVESPSRFHSFWVESHHFAKSPLAIGRCYVLPNGIQHHQIENDAQTTESA